VDYTLRTPGGTILALRESGLWESEDGDMAESMNVLYPSDRPLDVLGTNEYQPNPRLAVFRAAAAALDAAILEEPDRDDRPLPESIVF